MKYQAYPEYKDSGVEWIGVIPIHWYRLKFKFFANQGKVFASGPFGSSIGSQFYRDDGVPVIRGNNLSLDGNKPKYTDDGYVFLTEDKADELSNAEVLAGDLVFTARGTVGQVGLVPTDGSIKWSRAILSANQLRFRNRITNLSSQYLWYLFSSWFIRTQVLLSSDSVAQPNLNLGSLKDLHLLCPSFEEQRNIANFLDHETTKIDTLIEKQQQLIKLLKEKRQAVISHAVTKGLNPNAPMRDSDVEWLGEVPEHWDVCLIKYKCLEITDGAHVSPMTEGGERYFISITDIKNGVINFDDALLTTNASFEYLIKTGCMPLAGDILFSKDGTIGQTAITPVDIKFVVASSLIIIRPNKKTVTSEYLNFLLQSDVVAEQVESLVKGAALRRLSIQNLLKIGGVFPPISEQIDICLYLTKTLEKYDELETRARELIKLQQERRTALISAAVTGKIDVRNWQAPETLQSNIQTDKEE